MSLNAPIIEKARAKLNLCLHVGAARDDGYHPLESLVAFADIHDVIEVMPSQTTWLSATGRYAPEMGIGEDNLVLKAVRLMQEHHGCPKVHVHIEKNLPVGGGVGGGSADAAAALRACAHLLEIDVSELFGRALTLGADVPVCLLDRPAIMRGIGEQLEPVSLNTDLSVVLVNPGVHVSTADVFSAFDERDDIQLSKLPAGFNDPSGGHNDLLAPALQSAPVIADVLEVLGEYDGCQWSRMSGSGATCFGVFETARGANDAAASIGQAHPDWWCVSTTLRGQG